MTAPSDLDEDSADPHIVGARVRIGAVLQDKWTLDSLLGVGGMAAVYAATHRNGKRVAVKMLHSAFSHDEEVRSRFLQEGYAANTIQHDGAVSVLDDDVTPDGAAFIVMELLEGETVEQRWRQGGQRLPVSEVLWIADGLLDVLIAAHAKNVVHRDIKPENLFVTRVGALKVLDFGIAKVFERPQPRQSTTRAGMVMGTPAFMAPEQALAHWDDVDGRTDLWAVGATMFMLLSGRHVHDAQSSQEQLVLSATAPARSIATVTTSLPSQVVAIVDRALAFDRAARWPDATAMRVAVRAAIHSIGGGEEGGNSGRRPSATLLGDVGRPSAPDSATVLDTGGLRSGVAAWTQERAARHAEASKLRSTITERQGRLSVAKKITAEVEKRLDAGRAERTSLEQWFTRQVGTRTAAVEDARKEVRRFLVAIARQALSDRAAFGAEVDPAREQIAKLERAAESAARDVVVNEAAIDAYDAPALRIGTALLALAALIIIAALVGPIVWRATRVIEPPPARGHAAQH